MPADPLEALKVTLADVFGIEAGTIGDDTSVDTVESWDSLKHLSVVLALEERFGVSLTEEQTLEIMSFPLIISVLAEHGIEFPAR